MRMTCPNFIGLLAVAMLAAAPMPAFAYMGPGLGLGAIGTALGIVGAILLGLISLLWYPFKRLVRRLRGREPRPTPLRRSGR